MRRFACVAAAAAFFPVQSFIVSAMALSPSGPPAPLTIARNPADTRLFWRGQQFHVTPRQVRSERTIPVAGSPLTLMIWDEVGNQDRVISYQAISLDGVTIAKAEETSYQLKLRYAEFDPLAAIPAVRSAMSADQRNQVYIVQFVTQPLDEFRTAITTLGGAVHHFLANNACIVRMSPDVRNAVAALPFVRWVGPLHPAYRIEEDVRTLIDANVDAMPPQRYNIMVFEPQSNKAAVAQRIAGFGGIVNSADAGKFLIEATLTGPQLVDVLHWNEVLFVDRWGPYEIDMNNAREIGGANYVQTVAGFDGAGVRGEVFDVGFYPQHGDFQSRPLILHTAVSTASHGASTSGIIFGDGTGNASARGMLPAGQGIISDFDVIGVGTSRYTSESQLPQAPYFAVFQSSSVGSTLTTQYTTISADTDTFLFDFDVLHCQSQSNNFNQSSRPQAWAKNIVSVGGVRHFDTLTRSDDCWGCGTSGASIGPAADGRIKPDLCHFYDLVLCPTSGASNAYTSTFNGTSAATPIVAGHFGLFFQMWSQGIFGNSVTPGASVFENRPHMTTAKAMLINTASPYAFTGTTADLTRTHQGWGLPDLRYLYDIRQRMFIVDETRLLLNLQWVDYFVIVNPGEPSLRATLTWADRAGVPNSTSHRVNDLSLRLIAPDGLTAYWGNNGLLAGNTSTPGGTRDTRDTVENVIIPNPPPGVWTVRVSADQIVQDGHVETPAVVDADFALVVSGVTYCRKGDTSGDGRVDANDIPGAITLLLDSAGASTLQQCRADMNNDLAIDAADLQSFVQCVLMGTCPGV